MFSNGKALTTLVAESQRLAAAIKEGKLQTRPNPQAVSPQFRPVVEAMNAMADAFAAPQRGGRVCGPDLQGRYSAEDHRHLQWGLQRDQEQLEHLYRFP